MKRMRAVESDSVKSARKAKDKLRLSKSVRNIRHGTASHRIG